MEFYNNIFGVFDKLNFKCEDDKFDYTYKMKGNYNDIITINDDSIIFENDGYISKKEIFSVAMLKSFLHVYISKLALQGKSSKTYHIYKYDGEYDNCTKAYTLVDDNCSNDTYGIIRCNNIVNLNVILDELINVRHYNYNTSSAIFLLRK